MINPNSTSNSGANNNTSEWDTLKDTKMNNGAEKKEAPSIKEVGLFSSVDEIVAAIENSDRFEYDGPVQNTPEFEEAVYQEMQSEKRLQRQAKLENETPSEKLERRRAILKAEQDNLSKSIDNDTFFETKVFADPFEPVLREREVKTHYNKETSEKISRLEDVKKELKDMPDMAAHLKAKEEVEQAKAEKRKDDSIVDTCMELNQKEINEFRKKSFLERAKIVIQGNKPKQLTKKEALQKYGEQAVEVLTTKQLEQLEKNFEIFLKSADELEHNPVKKEAAIRMGTYSPLETYIKDEQRYQQGRFNAQVKQTNEEMQRLRGIFSVREEYANRTYGSETEKAS